MGDVIMDSIRISATDIDAFRYFMATEDMELAELLRRLRREEPPTEAMMAGTALHEALEHCQSGEHQELSANGYTFAFECEGEVSLPEIREVKGERVYQIDGCLITLVGKVDALDGRRVDDHKFTSRYDAERFLSSYQWRIYLEVFGADEFRWNVFEGRQDRRDPKRYLITKVHPLTTHRYPGLADDVERELGRFLEFARLHLPEKIEADAA